METTTSTTTDYHIYDPQDDPFLTDAFHEYCKLCLFRTPSQGALSCAAKTVNRVRCMCAFRDGGQCHPIPPQSTSPDYSGQLSTVCDLLSSSTALLSSIDSKTDDSEIDFDESMLSSETFKRIEKLGKLISPGFDTGNMTTSEWLKVMLIARKLRLQV